MIQRFCFSYLRMLYTVRLLTVLSTTIAEILLKNKTLSQSMISLGASSSSRPSTSARIFVQAAVAAFVAGGIRAIHR